MAHEQCVVVLEQAFQDLNIAISPDQIQSMSRLILEPMLGPWRFFHRPEHLFDVGGEDNPIEILAALFHDLVYIQIDNSISLNLSYYLGPFVEEEAGILRLRDRSHCAEDPDLTLIMALFGFSPGQGLNPYGGQNEFLSAIIATKVLGPFLSRTQILAIVACIEATIPFRVHEDPSEPAEQLYDRLVQFNAQAQLNLSPEELATMVHQAVRIANRDVLSFSASSADFLANTWNLLPETNHSLLPHGTYRICDYRSALEKMESFFCHLQAKAIFRTFRNAPANYPELLSQAERNLDVGRRYISHKIVGIVLLESISQSLGPNVALSTLMGEVPHNQDQPIRLEQFLSEGPVQPRSIQEQEVWLLMRRGRSQSHHGADLLRSPMAMFLLSFHGFDGMDELRPISKQWLSNEMTTPEFLAQFHPEALDRLIKGIDLLFAARQRTLSAQIPIPTIPTSIELAR
jgi:hypothetical protein